MSVFSKSCLVGMLALTTYVSDAVNLPSAPDIAKTSHKSSSYAKNAMVVTNNEWSTEAALQVLKEGGNATDAAITAAFVLGLTEPQSSGIGGGGYAISYHDKKIITYDGREVAPSTATPEWFLDDKKQPMDYDVARISAKAAGVPGEIAMLYKMHQDKGKLPWARLVQPAITLAENGFPMRPRLYAYLKDDDKDLSLSSDVRSVYYDSDGQIKPPGTIIKNPEYAKTLTIVAKDPMEFYNGDIANDIVDAVNKKAKEKLFAKKDLKNYQVVVSNTICTDYRGKYTICSVPPSTSGGVTVFEILGIYSKNYSGNNYNDPKWIYNFLEASKIAYADRNQYLADPAFVKQPVQGVLSDNYITQRSKLVSTKALATPVTPGVPDGIDWKYAPDNAPKPHGTTSIAIVDKDGNAVSMTVTVEDTFGSHLFVDGFFMNNEMTDFSFAPTGPTGKPIANRVEAGKRPRSSIAPSMVFTNKDSQLYAVAGAPGGSFIICLVAKSLIQMLDMGMSPVQATSSPNLCAVNDTPVIESLTGKQKSVLKSMNEKIIIQPKIWSGETNILRTKDGWLGGNDPRVDGKAEGY